MLLTTFDPFAEFDRLARGAFGPARGSRLQPAVRMDAIRREHDVQLRFDLPGIDPASIDVTVDRGVLTCLPICPCGTPSRWCSASSLRSPSSSSSSAATTAFLSSACERALISWLSGEFFIASFRVCVF